jgi:hypothetical protein
VSKRKPGERGKGKATVAKEEAAALEAGKREKRDKFVAGLADLFPQVVSSIFEDAAIKRGPHWKIKEKTARGIGESLAGMCEDYLPLTFAGHENLIMFLGLTVATVGPRYLEDVKLARERAKARKAKEARADTRDRGAEGVGEDAAPEENLPGRSPPRLA